MQRHADESGEFHLPPFLWRLRASAGLFDLRRLCDLSRPRLGVKDGVDGILGWLGFAMIIVAMSGAMPAFRLIAAAAGAPARCASHSAMIGFSALIAF